MSARGLALIAVALVLSGGVLAFQLSRGGADFVPARSADPCQDRSRTAVKPDLESVAEAVVLSGLDAAACDLGVTRERLLLALPYPEERAQLAREAGTDEAGLARAIHDGLRGGVDRLERNDQLPPVSALLPEIGDELGIPQNLVDLVPDGVVDDVVPTADALRWAVDQIDVNEVLANLEDSVALEKILRDALVQGAIDDVRARIKDKLPGPLQGLVG